VTEANAAYAGAIVAFATMHGKELLAHQAFRDTLGAEVVAVAGLDTDQFGTFTGDIARTLTPADTARAKARLGMKLAHTAFGLASEGSFSSPMGLLVDHHEVLVFVDDNRGLELVETLFSTSPVPSAMTVTSVDAAIRWASAAHFPQQVLVIRAGAHGDTIVKGIDTHDELHSRLKDVFEANVRVVIEPDYRAHRCPSRAGVITALAERMALRLATECEQCHTPGFGQVDLERGLPCEACGEPTHIVAAQIMGCGRCSFTRRVPRAEFFADARWCDGCNP
jgi:hypothetical protein